MKIFIRIFVCILLCVPSVLSDDTSDNEPSDNFNEDEVEQMDPYQEDSYDIIRSNPDPRDSTNAIELIIASLRDNAVDILQDIGDLEDMLVLNRTSSPKHNHTVSSNHTISSTTSKYENKDLGPPPCGKPDGNVKPEKQTFQKDFLEDGKEKIKLWDEQIKACKSILDHSKLSPKSKKHEQSQGHYLKKSTAREREKEDERKNNPSPQTRRRRKLIRESMENFRPVYYN